jgi:hypothetical protein
MSLDHIIARIWKLLYVPLCICWESADVIGIDLVGAVDEDGLWSWIHELGGAHERYGKTGMLEVMVTDLRILGTTRCEEAGLDQTKSVPNTVAERFITWTLSSRLTYLTAHTLDTTSYTLREQR